MQGGFLLCRLVPRFCASRRPVRRLLGDAQNFADESACPTADNIRNEGKFLPLFTDYMRC
jgi:hypothetical protein